MKIISIISLLNFSLAAFISNGSAMTFEESFMKEKEVFNSTYYITEGDILVDTSRKATRYGLLWEDGIISYALDNGLSDKLKKLITQAISMFEEKSCLKFQKLDKVTLRSKNVLFSSNYHSCSAELGWHEKMNQILNIGTSCTDIGSVLHEIGHMIGLYHEQNRSDRDKYIKILTENIQERYKHNFYLINTRNYNVPYDYTSIMQYSAWAFSKDSIDYYTILSLDARYQHVMGSANQLSFRDWKIINLMYCNSKYIKKCQEINCNEGYLQSNCTCACPEGLGGEFCEEGEAIMPGEDQLPCGGLVNKTGTYSTPNFPKRSHKFKNRNCIWIIKSLDSKKKVRVTFQEFHFTPKSTYTLGDVSKKVCYFDRIEVRTNGTKQPEKFVCGMALHGETKTSINDEMAILIYSKDIYYDGTGMQFVVDFVDDNEIIPKLIRKEYEEITCGNFNGSYYLSKGQKVAIMSPNYGISPYPPNFYCSVRVVAMEKTRVKFKYSIKEIHLEYSFSCKNDYVKIDGIRYCYKLYSKITRNNYETTVKFKSNAKKQRSGFKIIIEI